jgi:hypothetical protein
VTIKTSNDSKLGPGENHCTNALMTDTYVAWQLMKITVEIKRVSSLNTQGRGEDR